MVRHRGLEPEGSAGGFPPAVVCTERCDEMIQGLPVSSDPRIPQMCDRYGTSTPSTPSVRTVFVAV
eukprot:1209145-Amphidinium_carterae.1